MKAICSLWVFVAIAGGVLAQPLADLKLNTAATKVFTAKVQPVLSNVCADCHAHAKHSSGFKLKPYDPGFNDPQTADSNFQAVARLLDKSNPHASSFLKYATMAHGKADEPPLKAGHPALKVLELWVHWVCGPDGSVEPTIVPVAKVETMVVQAGATLPLQPTLKPDNLPPLKSVLETQFANTKAKPEPMKANPDDPFDPAGFNKR